jgi:hypothetical protein
MDHRDILLILLQPFGDIVTEWFNVKKSEECRGGPLQGWQRKNRRYDLLLSSTFKTVRIGRRVIKLLWTSTYTK